MQQRITLSLATPLASPGNWLADYYPSPLALGGQASDSFDPYWGAIDAMLVDEEVDADVELRHAAAMTLPWYLEGTPDDVAFAERALALVDMEGLLEDALCAAEWGFNPLEVEWSQEDGPWMPVRIERRHSRLFRIDAQSKLYYAAKGGVGFAPVIDGKVIAVRRKATKERPYGVSVLESIWPIWQVKWTHVAQLERLGQKYSVPSVVALANAVNAEQLGEISAILAGLESGEGVALSNVKDVVQLTASGKAQELLEVIRHYDTKISKRITGQTLTSNTQQYGSRSLGEVHERAALRIAIGDLKMVFGCLNATLLRWIFTLNNQPGQVRLVFDKKAFEESMKEQQSGGSGVLLANGGAKGPLLCL